MHKKFVVKGIVQGVFYRLSTQECAQRLGLQGWVCNKANGDVMLQATGEAEALNQLENWLWQGSENAKVDDVQVTTLDDRHGLEYDGFIIERDQA